MTGSSTSGEPILCRTCGVAPTTVAPPAAADDDDTVTHCEWCGAEYPVPHDHGTGEGDPGPTSPSSR